MLRSILLNLMPQWALDRARKVVISRRKRKFNAMPKLTEDGFRALLADELLVRPGSTVFIHSAVGKMNLAFGAYRVLQILLEVVGPEGTLLFPSYNTQGRPEDYIHRGEIFDLRTSMTVMGLLPEFARRYKGAIRSLHPTHSVAAIGKHARELTQTHPLSVYPCGDQSPYYKIVPLGGRIVGLGVSTANLSFAHCIEDVHPDRFPMKTRCDEVYTGKVRDLEGTLHEVKTLVAHKNIAWRDVPGYFRKYIPPQIGRDLTVQGVSYFTADAAALFDRMGELAAKGITIYSCGMLGRLRRWKNFKSGA